MIVQHENPKFWITEENMKAINKMGNNFENYLWFHAKPEHQIIRKAREKVPFCFAYFMVGSTQMLCFTTKEKPSQAYKIDKNYKQTYEVWKQAKFIRYCTSMDL